jgi:mannitol/fructose-specific phosphotransferase system IIA component (Ntr-type)
LGRCDQSLPWGAKAIRSVRLIFLIAVPATDSRQYLCLLSGLARLSKERELVEKLYAARDTFQILELLQQIKLRDGLAPDSTYSKFPQQRFE